MPQTLIPSINLHLSNPLIILRPIIARKRKESFRCTVRGLAAHLTYAPHGVNTIEYAADAVAFLKNLGRRHPDGGVRPGLDRAGAQAERVRHAGSDQPLRVVPAQTG